MNKTNCFHKYVSDIYAETITKEFNSDFEHQETLAFKPVTVRLPADTIQTIDNLSGYLGVSRQKFLAEAIDGSVGSALQAMAEVWASFDARREGRTPEEINDLVEEIRSDYIKRFVA